MTHPPPRHPAAACPTSSPRPEAPAGGPVIPLPARPPRGMAACPPATIKESLIVERHARDCGCDEPGGLLCRRAYPEDPDWCAVHGWTFEACCA